ncbi:uncharacterized protein LOC133525501 [Cydia pomonella]|uniref:uncharacterized protein LOC133525501 n=1 Tax=Cydia pomonella TaxID=82600 RepID=UPI002ADE6BFF|nr:uncharacterized protein LOC133525501 [Cydia pomonella]
MASSVLSDLNTVIKRFSEIGLILNFNKCEVFVSEKLSASAQADIITSFEHVTPNFTLQTRESLTLLGAPIYEDGIPPAINSKLDNFHDCSDLLFKINSHIALYILRLCLFSPKFLYILRCCPIWKFPRLTSCIDNTLKNSICKILNISLNPQTWSQATLPIKYGGLGIRSTGDLALPAFLSSVHSTVSLISDILNVINPTDVVVVGLAEAESTWGARFPGESPPTEKTSQAAWDSVNIKSIHTTLLNDSCNPSERARLLAVSEPESGHWLHALPSRNIGSLLDPAALRVAVCLRLGLKICEPHPCCRCGGPVEALGRHGLYCQSSAGRNFRHAALNDLIRRALGTVNIPATLEPVGLSAADGKRPDGCSLVPWFLGRPLAWDVTCVDTLAPSHVQGSSRKPGTAAEDAQLNKCRKYAFLKNNYIFAALAVETFGPWSSDTKQVVKEISHKLVWVSGDLRAGEYFAQRLSLAIQRGNAASVLGTMPQATLM